MQLEHFMGEVLDLLKLGHLGNLSQEYFDAELLRSGSFLVVLLHPDEVVDELPGGEAVVEQSLAPSLVRRHLFLHQHKQIESPKLLFTRHNLLFKRNLVVRCRHVALPQLSEEGREQAQGFRVNEPFRGL